MSYENKDRYLRVKQNLVLLELSRLKAVVQVNGKDTGSRSIEGAIVNDLAAIEANFTMPREMIENIPIYLDLCSENIHMKGVLEPIHSDDPRFKHVPVTPEDMHNAIFKFPTFDAYIEAYNENLKNQNFFDQSRKTAGRMIEASSLLIRAIRRNVEGHQADPDISLGQLLMMVNMVEVTEWLFEFTNATSRRMIKNVDDNVPGC